MSDEVSDFCCEQTGRQDQPYAFDFCEDTCSVLFPPESSVASSEPKSVQKSVVVTVGSVLGVLAVDSGLVMVMVKVLEREADSRKILMFSTTSGQQRDIEKLRRLGR